MAVALAAAGSAAQAQEPQVPLPTSQPVVGQAASTERPAPATAGDAGGDQAAPAGTRQALIEQEQAAKVPTLHPYVPNKAEKIFDRVDTILQGGTLRWHPFFDSAYSGGGFTLGIGHVNYLGGYNTLDVRGSYTISDYKRVEAEFIAPSLFHRRGALSILGGWREATQVGFYGVGKDTRRTTGELLFQQPYASALLTVRPTRRLLMLRGGSRTRSGSRSRVKARPRRSRGLHAGDAARARRDDHLPAHAGHGRARLAHITRLRATRRLLRRHGSRLHDSDEAFGFQQVDYEVIQHIPDPARDVGALVPRPRPDRRIDKAIRRSRSSCCPRSAAAHPARLRSWRSATSNSLLLQAEWRIMVNRYLDTALFYDAGKVAARRPIWTSTG